MLDPETKLQTFSRKLLVKVCYNIIVTSFETIILMLHLVEGVVMYCI